MKVIDLLDFTTCMYVAIVQNGNILFSGRVEDSPFKYIRREVLAFGFRNDMPEGNLTIAI